MRIAVQDVSGTDTVPSVRKISGWIRRSVGAEICGELSIRIVGEAESAELNRAYRHRRGPTNVLSFAGTPLPSECGEDARLLGDLVICAPVVAKEADAQGKPIDAHWAHIVLHGVLHLMGYDHESDAEARVMEDRERELLAMLGVGDPYAGER